MMQLREFDVIIDIKNLQEPKYLDTITKELIDEIQVVKDDSVSNKLNIYVEDGNEPYPIGDNNVLIVFRKMDGTIVTIESDDGNLVIENNVIKCVLSFNIVAIPNRQVEAEVIITGAGNQITSSIFYFRVRQGILTQDFIESTNEISFLNRLIYEAEEGEKNRNFEFERIMTSADETTGSLNSRISIADGLSEELQNKIVEGNDLDGSLENKISTGISLDEDLQTSIEEANIINSILFEEDGTINLANNIYEKLANEEVGAIILANEINNILTDDEIGTIKQAENMNETLEDTIFEGGQVFEDVNTLKGLRIEVGEALPTDTLFWYDISDTTEVERRVV